jgi:hypothetical protein
MRGVGWRIAGAAWLAATLLGALVGCRAAPRGAAFQPEVADGSRAVVYIYREPRRFGGKPISVYVNQEHAGELLPGQYMARVVAPGECFIRAECVGSAVRQAAVRAGDAVFFSVQTGRFGRIVSVEIPEVSEARALIAGTVRADP